jgi:hypothetical protein
MKIGTLDIANCKIGSTQVNEVRIGSTLVWQFASLDPDAQAFLTATGITDLTITNAINTLVVDLKGYSLWAKMKALYPFVGGTATTHKFNLKNPLDTDAAFRLSFSGGVTHDANGITGNGSNGGANTFINPSTHLTVASSHVSYYSRSNIQNGSLVFDEGLYVGSNTAYTLSFIRNTSNAAWSAFWGDANLTTGTITDSRGLFVGTRQDSTNSKMFFNNSLKGNNTAALSTTRPNGVISLLHATGLGGYSARNLAFYSRGDGLTDTDVANLTTAVQAFQTALSRNV